MRKFLSVVAVALLLSGCGGPTYKIVRQNPEFKLSNLKSEGVVVLGTVSIPRKLENKQRIHYGTLLSDSIKKKSAAARIYSPGEVAERVGVEKVQGMLSEYRETRQLMAASLGEIRNAFSAKYVMVSSINSNYVMKDHSSHKGDKAIYYNLKTKRKIETDIAIFNLDTGKITWIGRSFKGFTKSELVKENASSEKGLMRLVDSYMTAEKLKKLYPKPASTRKALSRLYSGFSRDVNDSGENEEKS